MRKFGLVVAAIATSLLLLPGSAMAADQPAPGPSLDLVETLDANAAPICPPNYVCVWTGQNFTGTERTIPVSALYDCKRADLGTMVGMSLYNNTKFPFYLVDIYPGGEHWLMGTAAAYQYYGAVSHPDLVSRHFDYLQSPPCW